MNLPDLFSKNTALTLSRNLTEIPIEVLSQAEILEYLDLSNNNLKDLPDNFAILSKLQIAFFSSNQFEEYPPILLQCPCLKMIAFRSNKIHRLPELSLSSNLCWLILTNNLIEELPKSIGQCTKLRKLMLAGNKLKDLPQELSRCHNLELLRVSANELTEIKPWLFTMPKLAWISYSGNVLNKIVAPTEQILEISWQDLTLGSKLGEGASGVVMEAVWQGKKVALKIFKGAITSDGYPADEINVWRKMGNHEHLASVLGYLTHHPDAKAGLIFELIPPNFTSLGTPPTFETCTRDTFKANTEFTLDQVGSILSGIVSACLHLHKMGIIHGDLYAHNILVNDVGYPILADFGAATIYDPTSDLAPVIERTEVRAFGCLIDDLLQHVKQEIPLFEKLKMACLNENVGERPGFRNIQNYFVNSDLNMMG